MEVLFVLGPSVSFLVSLLCARSFLQCKTGYEHEQQSQEEWTENRRVQGVICAARDVVVCSRRYSDREDTCHNQFRSKETQRAAPTELDEHLAEVIRVARPGKEPNVADSAVATVSSTEPVLLDVGNTFHDESD